MDKENMALYDLMREVPKEARKEFRGKGGFSGTDINPMWRIKRMTEIFGPCGAGWYYEVAYRHMETSSDDVTKCVFIGVNLYVKRTDGEWSKPIYGEGGNTFCEKRSSGIFTTDEAYKMALTDAISNATKQLGLGADVWFEADNVHSTKYDQQKEAAQKAATTAKPAQGEQLQAVTNKAPQNAQKPAQQPVTVTQEDITKAYAFINGNENAYKHYVSKFMLAGSLKGTADDFDANNLHIIATELKKGGRI